MIKKVTFLIEGSCEVNVNVPDAATENEIRRAAIDAVHEVDTGELTNVSLEISEIE